MPKVSVLIPNYNHACFLEQRIQSILAQTYEDFEIIYLDDRSTDHSHEIFAKFADDPRIRSILNAENSGSPFKQWNKGIRAATGDYLWIAESDDYADPDFLATLVQILDENPQVGVAYCQSYQVDAKGKIIGTMHAWTDDLNRERWRQDFIHSGLYECQNYLAIKNTIPNASAVLTRRTLWLDIGYAEESMVLCGDWDAWLKLLQRSDVAFTAKTLNYYRCHSSSVRSHSGANGRAVYERMQVFGISQQQIAIAPEAAESLKNQFAHDWMQLVAHGRINLQRNWEFYQLARTYDSIVVWRCCKLFTSYGIQLIMRRLESLVLFFST